MDTPDGQVIHPSIDENRNCHTDPSKSFTSDQARRKKDSVVPQSSFDRIGNQPTDRRIELKQFTVSGRHIMN